MKFSNGTEITNSDALESGGYIIPLANPGVSNHKIAPSVLRQYMLKGYAKNAGNGVAGLDASGKLPVSLFPSAYSKGTGGGVAPLASSGRVETKYLPESIPSAWYNYIFSQQWIAMLDATNDNDDYRYPYVGRLDGTTFVPSATYNLIRNGYFPDQDATNPYWIHGCKLNLLQAMRVMASTWVPTMHGALATSRTHKRQPLYNGADATEGSFSLAMANCRGLSQLWSVDLVGKLANMADNIYDTDKSVGICPKITPNDMYRAFESNTQLVLVNGEIDMRYLNDKKVFQAFYGCTNLRFLRIAAIPNSVTTLDFRGCKRLWPHLFHQITFWDGANEVTTPPASRTSVLTIKIDKDLFDAYENMDADIWKSYYKGYTFTEWLAHMKARKIQFVADDTNLNTL